MPSEEVATWGIQLAVLDMGFLRLMTDVGSESESKRGMTACS